MASDFRIGPGRCGRLDRRGRRASQSADMILTCPACATSYFVSDDAIGPNGRRVRCKACGHDWRAMPEDEPLELSAAEEPAVEAGFGKREEAPESLAETPAPELPRAFRAKAEQQRKMRRARPATIASISDCGRRTVGAGAGS